MIHRTSCKATGPIVLAFFFAAACSTSGPDDASSTAEQNEAFAFDFCGNGLDENGDGVDRPCDNTKKEPVRVLYDVSISAAGLSRTLFEVPVAQLTSFRFTNTTPYGVRFSGGAQVPYASMKAGETMTILDLHAPLSLLFEDSQHQVFAKGDDTLRLTSPPEPKPQDESWAIELIGSLGANVPVTVRVTPELDDRCPANMRQEVIGISACVGRSECSIPVRVDVAVQGEQSRAFLPIQCPTKKPGAESPPSYRGNLNWSAARNSLSISSQIAIVGRTERFEVHGSPLALSGSLDDSSRIDSQRSLALGIKGLTKAAPVKPPAEVPPVWNGPTPEDCFKDYRHGKCPPPRIDSAYEGFCGGGRGLFIKGSNFQLVEENVGNDGYGELQRGPISVNADAPKPPGTNVLSNQDWVKLSPSLMCAAIGVSPGHSLGIEGFEIYVTNPDGKQSNTVTIGKAEPWPDGWCGFQDCPPQ